MKKRVWGVINIVEITIYINNIKIVVVVEVVNNCPKQQVYVVMTGMIGCQYLVNKLLISAELLTDIDRVE